jgi:Leucine-rich repeat (LRR) protein
MLLLKEKSMLEEIDVQVGDSSKEDVSQLILDRCKCSCLPKEAEDKIETFTNLEVLTLNGVGLTSLENFPRNTKLKKLELNDNQISAGLSSLDHLNNLVSLKISGNQIESIEELKCLNKLTEVAYVALFGNPLTKKEN